MNHVPVCIALSLAILYILVGVPPSTASKVACVALGLALLHFANRAKASAGEETGFGKDAESSSESETQLDDELLASVLDNLKFEPSEELREMLARSSEDRWSPEALQAARLLLDQRASDRAAEPVYRTVPRTEQDQASREGEAVAPRFSRRLLALDVGSRVYCPWRNQTGTIVRWQDEEERFYIRYDNGDGDWATLGMFE